jgi:hypothetical protein
VASTEDAGLKDTKRIRFPQDFDKKRQQGMMRKKQVARQSRVTILDTRRRGGAWTIIAFPLHFAQAE